MIKQEKILNHIISELRSRKLLASIQAIYLFGSRAIGDANERSDIDIAILCKPFSKKIWFDIMDVIEDTDTLLKIDVVDLAHASEKLQKDITQYGKLIYERKKG